MCVCVYTYTFTHIYIHTYVYIYIYIYIYREEGEDNLRPRHSRDFGDRRQSEVPTDLDNTRLGNKWVGATGKWCRVPNVPMHKLDADHRGCFVLAFSTFGRNFQKYSIATFIQ